MRKIITTVSVAIFIVAIAVMAIAGRKKNVKHKQD